MTLCIEVLHNLWLERYRIAYECIISRIKVDDHYNLLNQVKELYYQSDISLSSVLNQYKHRLSKVNTETLRGIVYEFMLTMNANSD